MKARKRHGKDLSTKISVRTYGGMPYKLVMKIKPKGTLNTLKNNEENYTKN